MTFILCVFLHKGLIVPQHRLAVSIFYYFFFNKKLQICIAFFHISFLNNSFFIPFLFDFLFIMKNWTKNPRNCVDSLKKKQFKLINNKKKKKNLDNIPDDFVFFFFFFGRSILQPSLTTICCSFLSLIFSLQFNVWGKKIINK